MAEAAQSLRRAQAARKPDLNSTISLWALWVLVVVVVLLLMVSWTLFNQVRAIQNGFDAARIDLIQHQKEDTIKQCAILVKLGVEGDDLAAVGCEVK